MRTYPLVLTAILLLSLLFGLVPAALAAPPEFDTVELVFIFPIVGCAFPAQGELYATLKTSFHTDQNGDFKMLIERVQDQRTSYTNLTTGTSLTSTKGAGIDKFVVAEDGTILFVVMGLIDIVPIPRQGLVIQDVGHFIFNSTTGELLFSAGQFTVHGPLGSVEALCAALE